MENNTTHICKYCNAETNQPDEQCYANPNNAAKMNKQQTAVEWLEFEITKRGPHENNPPQWLIELYEQAKEMEKEQIIDAFDEGQEYEYQYHINSTPKFYSETYYRETYGE
jgi:hypothetical protein